MVDDARRMRGRGVTLGCELPSSADCRVTWGLDIGFARNWSFVPSEEMRSMSELRVGSAN